MLLNYKDYEKQVYDWLMAKHNTDENFTFSLRQNGSKGSELDYFIGTSKSKYFGITFWTLPISYPGSSSDCINVIFFQNQDQFNYYIEFNQTNSPDTPQNQSALNVVKALNSILSQKNNFIKQGKDDNKMFTIKTKSKEEHYHSLNEMFKAIEIDLDFIIPIVDQQIKLEQSINPEFVAHRISVPEFDSMHKKMEIRFNKYAHVNNEIVVNYNENPDLVLKNENPQFPLNQILYGPPGTGKTYNSINTAISIINPSFDLTQSRDIVKTEYQRLVESGQVVFTTFHQSMSYEDFIEGIKPETKNEKVTYEIKDGVFKKLCKEASAKKIAKNFDDSYSKFVEEVLSKGSISLETPTHKKKFKVIINSNETAVAIPETEKGTNMGVTKEMSRDYVVNGAIRDWKPYTTSIGEYIKSQYPVEIDDVSNSNKKYVLIVDEINRGNVSAIFGELITLLEEDKRLKTKESLELILPYSKVKFGVPSNVYIIGTMNTADRSVEALDTALRRRFSFSEIMPNPELLEEIQFNGFNLSEVLKTINERIEVLLDRDHTIGHSYFLKVENGDTQSLKSVFKNNIFPLLQEYFYHDYEKIALILGEGFVSIKENQTVKFAKFNDITTPDIATQFELIDKIVDIEEAVHLLLNRNV